MSSQQSDNTFMACSAKSRHLHPDTVDEQNEEKEYKLERVQYGWLGDIQNIAEKLKKDLEQLTEEAQKAQIKLEIENEELKKRLFEAEEDLRAKEKALEEAKRKLTGLNIGDRNEKLVDDGAWQADIENFSRECHKYLQDLEAKSASMNINQQIEQLTSEVLDLTEKLREKDEALEKAAVKVRELEQSKEDERNSFEDVVEGWKQKILKVKRECQKDIEGVLADDQKTFNNLRTRIEILNVELADVREDLDVKDYALRTAIIKRQQLKSGKYDTEGDLNDLQIYWREDISKIHQKLIKIFEYLTGNTRDFERYLQNGKKELKKKFRDMKQEFVGTLKDLGTVHVAASASAENVTGESNELFQNFEGVLNAWFLGVGERFKKMKKEFLVIRDQLEGDFLREASFSRERKTAKQETEDPSSAEVGESCRIMSREGMKTQAEETNGVQQRLLAWVDKSDLELRRISPELSPDVQPQVTQGKAV